MRTPPSISNLAYRLLCAVLVLNAVDAVATLLSVKMGWAEEANPLMAHLLEFSSVGFVGTKILLVSLCVLLLARHLAVPLAQFGAVATSGVYSLLMVHHATGLGARLM